MGGIFSLSGPSDFQSGLNLNFPSGKWNPLRKCASSNDGAQSCQRFASSVSASGHPDDLNILSIISHSLIAKPGCWEPSLLPSAQMTLWFDRDSSSASISLAPI